MRVDVFIYVQHLLGIGHLKRASLLAKAMHKIGLKVIFVTGGRPVPDLNMGKIETLQLPPLRAADDSFKVLMDIDDQVVDEDWKNSRKETLLEAFKTTNPKVLLIEMFPFGRRQMRFELDPLIARAKEQGVPVVTSVRDILTTHKTPGKGEWIIERVLKDIDQVLVHGDSSFISLQDSFPLAEKVAHKITYTGYVVETSNNDTVTTEKKIAFPQNKAKDNTQHGTRNGVLISAGGGAVALPLAKAVLEAKNLCKLKDIPWRLLLGDNLPDRDFDEISNNAPKGLTVERNRPDFQALLKTSQLSVSQAGYNTILELLTTLTPAIVVPFAADTQSEQTTRAKKLEDYGVLTVISEKDLSPVNLAHAIDAAIDRPVTKITLDLNGTENSALIIQKIIQKNNTHG
ncbi:glycosyltransferase family protein [Kiloniella antarctica]|uniref:Glycosyltransferase family protein n=1 Tax=Kiloniella antarctica TaxID=1550907 RepID=A0ABW5BJ35_9PROT